MNKEDVLIEANEYILAVKEFLVGSEELQYMNATETYNIIERAFVITTLLRNFIKERD